MMYRDRFSVNLKKVPCYRLERDDAETVISETGIKVDQIIIEENFKLPILISI